MSVRDAIMVARACVLLFAAACELEPPPKQKPAAPAPAPAVAQPPAPAPAPPAAPAADAGAPQEDVSQACMQIGVHFADVWIGEAKDPQDKAQLEQERALLVRRTAVACTQGGWSDEVRTCIAAAKSRTEVQACEKKIAPAAPPQK